ncbi:hypothetical protein AM1BK_30960 [Neobacillus kokaensis]|uniref:Thioredoxin-like fold domain-containing protein n=1 Tax=Neobacillus kokaensis TaxID=2759023 RepID=A0ABQ3N6D2_9BACI|nr:hypothetical protein AM1BK_30960 [Neobacillus kokaensis]
MQGEIEADQIVNLSKTKDENDLVLAERYVIKKTPTLVLLDNNGKVIDKYAGVGQKRINSKFLKRGFTLILKCIFS